MLEIYYEGKILKKEIMYSNQLNIVREKIQKLYIQSASKLIINIFNPKKIFYSISLIQRIKYNPLIQEIFDPKIINNNSLNALKNNSIVPYNKNFIKNSIIPYIKIKINNSIVLYNKYQNIVINNNIFSMYYIILKLELLALVNIIEKEVTLSEHIKEGILNDIIIMQEVFTIEELKIYIFGFIDHINNYSFPNNDTDFGYMLAGLIEGDGGFGSYCLVITYHINDAFAAKKLQERIGYGKVKPLKNVRAVTYYLSEKEGIKKVLNLVNGKFVTENKVNQLRKFNFERIYGIPILPPMNTNLSNNYWLSGFSDADSSLNISVCNNKTHKLGQRVKIKFEIQQKDPTALLVLNNFIKGHLSNSTKILKNIDKEKEKESIIKVYSLSSILQIKDIVQYFDKFPLFSTKYIQYYKWRIIHKMMLNKEHLTPLGLKKIILLKQSIEYNRK